MKERFSESNNFGLYDTLQDLFKGTNQDYV